MSQTEKKTDIWIEILFFSQLSVQIFLSHLPQDLLEKCLKSTK